MTSQTELSRAGLEREDRTRFDDPVSPELALVDPDLARRQRAQLPDPLPIDDERPARRAAPRPDVRVGRTLLLDAAAVTEPAPSRNGARRLLKLVTLLSLMATTAVVAITVATSWRKGDRPSLLPPPPPERSQAAGEDANASQPARTPTGRSDATPERQPRSQKREGIGQKATERRPSPPSPTAAATKPRAFSWLPVARATHYRVEFYRGRRRVFQAFPVQARLVVPGRWSYRGRMFAFAPGAYRWIVRPGFGARTRPRYGAPVVSSSWVVPE